jgi:parallel beta helix pectate lyase-like protein
MSPRLLTIATLVTFGLAFTSATSDASVAGHPRTLVVSSDRAFLRAERALARTGGTIVLQPRLYRRLTISARSRRPLRILGTPGARVEQVYLYGTQRVSFGRITLGPIGGDALLELHKSRDVDLHHLVVTARGGRRSSSVLVADSRLVTIRDSDFSHCGDWSRAFVNCVTLWRWSHDVLIERNRFHDCRGCDFVHGRFGTNLTIRDNTFDRSLPCRIKPYRCGHQDLVQLFAGRHLRVTGNRFGVYRDGGAQLYLTGRVDYATVVNNVFLATDPRVPGYRARMGIVVGSNRSRRLPEYARIVNNTILSGARRRDGYAGSIRMSTRYGAVRHWKRPIVANNVLALLETPGRVCAASQRFLDNVVVRGRSCSREDLVGPAGLDGRGRPRAGSPVIDGGNRHFAPTRDTTGRRRGAAPDIGAYEFRPAR